MGSSDCGPLRSDPVTHSRPNTARWVEAHRHWAAPTRMYCKAGDPDGEVAHVSAAGGRGTGMESEFGHDPVSGARWEIHGLESGGRGLD